MKDIYAKLFINIWTQLQFKRVKFFLKNAEGGIFENKTDKNDIYAAFN